MNPSSRPHCLGPVFATGTHRRNLFGPLGTRTRVRACVRATVCSQVVTKIDRGGLVHGMKKTGVREREREREGEREAEETEASLHQGVEDGQNGRVVRPNDDIPRLRSKFSQLTSRITRPRETRIFRKATRFPLILPLLLPLPLPLLRHAQDDG